MDHTDLKAAFRPGWTRRSVRRMTPDHGHMRDLFEFLLEPVVAHGGIEALHFTVPALREPDTDPSTLTFFLTPTGIHVRAGYEADVPTNPDAMHGGSLADGPMSSYEQYAPHWRMLDRETMEEFDVHMSASRAVLMDSVDIYVHVGSTSPLHAPSGVSSAARNMHAQLRIHFRAVICVPLTPCPPTCPPPFPRDRCAPCA